MASDRRRLNTFTHADVNSISEIPEAPEGFKYLEFIGGAKELRCFLVPVHMSRSTCIDELGPALGPCLAPILDCDGIVVRQDTSFALPGFYIVSLSSYRQAIDELNREEMRSLSEVIRRVRRAMREALKINQVHLRCEEKISTSYALHYWLLPVGVEAVPQDVIDCGIVRDYLSRFIFTKNFEKILKANEAMRAALIKP